MEDKPLHTARLGGVRWSILESPSSLDAARRTPWTGLLVLEPAIPEQEQGHSPVGEHASACPEKESPLPAESGAARVRDVHHEPLSSHLEENTHGAGLPSNTLQRVSLKVTETDGLHKIPEKNEDLQARGQQEGNSSSGALNEGLKFKLSQLAILLPGYLDISLADSDTLNSDDEDVIEESVDDLKNRFADIITQMMYVSGETAEPSVETTGIIEDIVRQQVIELVSTNFCELSSPNPQTTDALLVTKLYRACLTTRLKIHQHQRSHLPDPARPGQSVASAHISLVEGRAKEC